MNIERNELLLAFVAFARAGNGVVIGPPGVGKTHLLRRFESRSADLGALVLFWPLDKMDLRSEADLVADMQLKTDLFSYLKEAAPPPGDRVGVLVIDAFDAVRSGKAQALVISLIKRVMSRFAGVWNVVVSVRTYDAARSSDLLELFPPVSDGEVSSAFQVTGIERRHFFVPKLSEIEVNAAAASIPNLSPIVSQSSSDFKALLQIPFNLWLLDRLLSRNPHMPELTALRSEVQLLGLFWKKRVTEGYLGHDKNMILSKVARLMVDDRALSVRQEDVYVAGAGAAWDELLSAEVLTQVQVTAQRVSFAHNVLFDYAVSVLLIEDDPKHLMEFIAEDASRPLFLRPSLSYYCARLWHTSPDVFWAVFWQLLEQSNLSLRLLARLLPPGTVVTEARTIEQLGPVLDGLSSGRPMAMKAVKRLLQARRALRVERTLLWAEFLDAISKHIHRDFAGELADTTSEILERSAMTGSESVVDICGRVGRRLLGWVWQHMEDANAPWISRLGAVRAVPLVARTFATDLGESRRLLQPVIEKIGREGYPIDFVFWLTHELDRVWPWDPEFAASTYLAVFRHKETSSDPTYMGGIIVSMTSNRRQDYEGCQYALTRHFPAFLLARPAEAVRAAVGSLSYFVINEHVRPSVSTPEEAARLILQFPFRGKTAHVIPDGSAFWSRMEHREGTLTIADALFRRIAELSKTAGGDDLDTLLDTFADEAVVAYLWSRLLAVAATAPAAFAPWLFELCIAEPILAEGDTLHEVCSFLAAAAPFYSDQQRRQIEECILRVHQDRGRSELRPLLERRRARLLAAIPRGLLVTDEAREIRAAMEMAGDLPSNEPLGTFTSTFEPYTDDEYLAERGVNLSDPVAKELRALGVELDKFATEWQNKVPPKEAIAAILPIAEKTHNYLVTHADANRVLHDSTWCKLASTVETVSRANTDGVPEVPVFCRTVLLESAQHRLPEPDPGAEANYTYPSWSPAPRNEAAQGLPLLSERKADREVLNAIGQLCSDPAPSVRFLVMNGLFRLMRSAPDDFWRLAASSAECEQNHVVQQALARTLIRVAAGQPDRAASVAARLFLRAESTESPVSVPDELVALVVGLAIAKDNSWAQGVIQTWLNDPSGHASLLKRAAFDALEYIAPSNLGSERGSVLAPKAVRMLLDLNDAASQVLGTLRSIPSERWDEQTRTLFRDAYGVADEIITRIYFAADVSDDLRNGKRQPLADGERAKFYATTKPILEAVLGHALEENSGILVAHTAHYFMQLLNGVLPYDPKGALHMAAGVVAASKSSSYNFDPLAVKEAVRMVEAILAGYRQEVSDGQSLQDLLNLLDAFVEAGWPDALRLVWRLDEVFR